jgi:hypothetical protein
MKRKLLTGTLLGVLAAYACPAYADGSIGMLPPTPLGSKVDCPAGTQQLLSYSGTPMGGPQAGINCVPVTTDAAGDVTASGYVQMGHTSVACDASHAGAVRFNSATLIFEGCNGVSWQAIGGGTTVVVGGCMASWASCPAGYRATSYFSPGTYNCCDRCGNPAWRYTVCSQ